MLPVLSLKIRPVPVPTFAPVTADPIESTYALVAASVGLVTVPFKVIILVAKLPEASRNTIVFIESALVAVVAELATLPAVLIVASLVSAIAAAASISAFTMSELDSKPDALLCTTPAVPNAFIVTPPVGLMFMRSAPFVAKESVFNVAAEKPVLTLPVN